MNRACTLGFAVLTLAVLSGCSSKPSGDTKKKAAAPLDRIQGKVQVIDPDGATDAALNSGGSSVYLWEGTHRYRLFFRTGAEVTHGDEYLVEGVYAQKAIDEIGDPDQGKNGYPLPASCERVVNMAWTNLPFDAVEAHAAALRGRIRRYPARPVFLVSRIQAVTSDAAAAAEQKKKEAAAKNIPEISVPADKQRALLAEGSPVQTAPLWQPEGGTARCKVIIDPEGKISELETGLQLCEQVQWSQFRYQPTVQGGRPVKVSTEVEVRFEPRK